MTWVKVGEVPEAEAHEGEVRRKSPGGWRAGCSCGWSATGLDNARQAWAAFYRHCPSPPADERRGQ